MTHGSRTYVNCALTPYAVDGVPSSKQAVVFPPKTPTGTCDAKICTACGSKPAAGKDLCPAHTAEWKAR